MATGSTAGYQVYVATNPSGASSGIGCTDPGSEEPEPKGPGPSDPCTSGPPNVGAQDPPHAEPVPNTLGNLGLLTVLPDGKTVKLAVACRRLLRHGRHRPPGRRPHLGQAKEIGELRQHQVRRHRPRREENDHGQAQRQGQSGATQGRLAAGPNHDRDQRRPQGHPHPEPDEEAEAAAETRLSRVVRSAMPPGLGGGGHGQGAGISTLGELDGFVDRATLAPIQDGQLDA